MVNYKICSSTAMGEYEYFLKNFYDILDEHSCDSVVVVQIDIGSTKRDICLSVKKALEVVKGLNGYLFVNINSTNPDDTGAKQILDYLIGKNVVQKGFNYVGRVLCPGKAPFLMIADTENLHSIDSKSDLFLNTSNWIYSEIERMAGLVEGAISDKQFRKLIDKIPGLCSSVRTKAPLSYSVKTELFNLAEDRKIHNLKSF